MRLITLLLSISFPCLVLVSFSELHASAQSEGPVVTDCTPKSGSIDSVLELHGFRINRSDKSNTKVYFLQNGNKYLAHSGGGSGTTNDDGHGRQSLEIVVPKGLVPGLSRIIVEANGIRSAPVTVNNASRVSGTLHTNRAFYAWRSGLDLRTPPNNV